MKFTDKLKYFVINAYSINGIKYVDLKDDDIVLNGDEVQFSDGEISKINNPLWYGEKASVKLKDCNKNKLSDTRAIKILRRVK